MRLQKEHWGIRPLRAEDAPLLYGWLTDPRILEYYEGRDASVSEAWIQRHFYEEEEADMERHILEYDQVPIGYMQCYVAGRAEYEYEGTEERIYAMDQWIAPEYWNQGNGRRLISLALDTLIEERGAQVVLLDPHVDNPRAIRCYERCGFRAIKKLPSHEWHEGRYVDCLLMAYRPDCFKREIQGWTGWAKVFQDLSAFRPLMDRILDRERIRRPEEYDHLTPGTNAVFRAGDKVMKIFAPMESGLDTRVDEETERHLLETWAGRIPIPRLLGWGSIRDRYTFRYLIQEYIEGEEAGEAIRSWSQPQKAAFVEALHRVLAKIHQPDGALPAMDYVKRAIESPRIRRLPQLLQTDFRQRQTRIAESYRAMPTVLVHGDLTGENVLVCEDGSLCILDWADACLAAETYEWPPIVFELFRCDAELTRCFCREDPKEFTHKLVDALVLHDFGADILLEWEARQGIRVDSLQELEEWLERECLHG